MAVFVDNMQARYRGMIMCHMVAHTLEELHEMADQLGLKREWFQDRPGFPHYDICQTKKAQAIKLGAVEVTTRDMVMTIRPVIQQFPPAHPAGSGEEEGGAPAPSSAPPQDPIQRGARVSGALVPGK